MTEWTETDNLGDNRQRLPFPLYKIRIPLVINSMLNHVALLNLRTRSSKSMLSLSCGNFPKSCFGVVYIEVRERGVTKFVFSMYANFTILAGMVSRVMSKIAGVENVFIAFSNFTLFLKYFDQDHYRLVSWPQTHNRLWDRRLTLSLSWL